MIKKMLSPDRVKVLVSLVVLSLPLWKERIPVESGGVVVERVIPITLLPAYIVNGGDFQSLLLLLGFYVFVYVIVAFVIEILRHFLIK